MDTNLLRSFIAVAETRSFSAAADRMNVTQSTISHQIARLEEHLGKQLFRRTTRSCQLTAEGAELMSHAGRILASVDEMERSFRPSLLRGTVVVGVPDDQHLFLPLTRALATFMTRHPGVALEIRAGLSSDLSRDLRERKIDVAVVREVPGDTNAASSTEALVWVAGEAWSRPADGVVPLALVSAPCIYRRTALASLDRIGLASRCLVNCTSLEGVLAVVEANLAVSVITAGDLRPGVVRLAQSAGLPPLPTSSLRIGFSTPEPSVAARSLSVTLAQALGLQPPAS